MKVKSRKKILLLAAIGAVALTIVIVLVTVVMPPIKERAIYEQALGFVPPWEEVEYQVISLYKSNGKIYKHSEYVAKYVIAKEQLSQATELIKNAKGIDENGYTENIYKGGTTRWDTDIKDLNYSKRGPNQERNQDRYQSAYPVTWWDIEPEYIADNIIEYYGGSFFVASEEDYFFPDIMFMPADEDNIYIYIYIYTYTYM